MKGKEAQDTADKNETKTLHKIVRDLSRSRNNSNIPIKDKNGNLLFTGEEQNARWVDYFKEVLNQSNPKDIFDFNLETIHPEPDITYVTYAITKEEVKEAIKNLKNNKAADVDRVTAELIKEGGKIATNALLKLLNHCWISKFVPDEWRIVKLPKKDLIKMWALAGNNLIGSARKNFVLLFKRLQEAMDSQLREEQAGFRKDRLCCEHIITLRNIIEQCLEFQKPLYIKFIDCKKAFDSVDGESIWKIAHIYGILDKLVNMFKSIYQNSTCSIKTEDGFTDYILIETGLRQLCILSPFLFIVVLDFIMKKSTNEKDLGIYRKWILCYQT